MSNPNDDPWESTVREALAAIQRHGSDLDMNARMNTPRHQRWLLRIDAIECVLGRVVLRKTPPLCADAA